MSSVERNLSKFSPAHVLLQFSSIWYIAQWNIVVQIVPFLESFYTLLWNPLKHQTTPLIIEVHFDPKKYKFADCSILGDFAYISFQCLFIYLWRDHKALSDHLRSLILYKLNLFLLCSTSRWCEYKVGFPNFRSFSFAKILFSQRKCERRLFSCNSFEIR